MLPAAVKPAWPCLLVLSPCFALPDVCVRALTSLKWAPFHHLAGFPQCDRWTSNPPLDWRQKKKKKLWMCALPRTSTSVNNHLLHKVKALICAFILQFAPLMKPSYFFTSLQGGVEPEYSRKGCRFLCADPDPLRQLWTRKATFEQQRNGNGVSLFSKFSKSEFSVLDENVGLFSSKFRFDALTVWRAEGPWTECLCSRAERGLCRGRGTQWVCALCLHTGGQTWTQHYHWLISCFMWIPVRLFSPSPLFTYRLNHGILDPPVAVLLHPGLLDDQSSALFSCL